MCLARCKPPEVVIKLLEVTRLSLSCEVHCRERIVRSLEAARALEEERGDPLPIQAVSLMERADTIRALPLRTAGRASLDLLAQPAAHSPIKDAAREVKTLLLQSIFNPTSPFAIISPSSPLRCINLILHDLHGYCTSYVSCTGYPHQH